MPILASIQSEWPNKAKQFLFFIIIIIIIIIIINHEKLFYLS